MSSLRRQKGIIGFLIIMLLFASGVIGLLLSNPNQIAQQHKQELQTDIAQRIRLISNALEKHYIINCSTGPVSESDLVNSDLLLSTFVSHKISNLKLRIEKSGSTPAGIIEFDMPSADVYVDKVKAMGGEIVGEKVVFIKTMSFKNSGPRQTILNHQHLYDASIC